MKLSANERENLRFTLLVMAGGSLCSAQVEVAERMLDHIDGLLSAAHLQGMEQAAGICKARAENRFCEHGTTESDTNASYYQGHLAEFYEAQDEEDENCATAIRNAARAEVAAGTVAPARETGPRHATE